MEENAIPDLKIAHCKMLVEISNFSSGIKCKPAL